MPAHSRVSAIASGVADQTTADELWRLPQVQQRVPLSESRIYTLQSQGQFPRPFPVGSRAVAWRRSDIEAWLRRVALERELRKVGLKTGKRGPLPKAAQVAAPENGELLARAVSAAAAKKRMRKSSTSASAATA